MIIHLCTAACNRWGCESWSSWRKVPVGQSMGLSIAMGGYPQIDGFKGKFHRKKWMMTTRGTPIKWESPRCRISCQIEVVFIFCCMNHQLSITSIHDTWTCLWGLEILMPAVCPSVAQWLCILPWWNGDPLNIQKHWDADANADTSVRVWYIDTYVVVLGNVILVCKRYLCVSSLWKPPLWYWD